MQITYGPEVLVGVELSIAFLAKVSAVASVAHVLVGSAFGTESTITSVTLKLRPPMIHGIHVLIACLLTAELTIARVALDPMPVKIHMLVTFNSVVELLAAARAFKHLGGQWWIEKPSSLYVK